MTTESTPTPKLYQAFIPIVVLLIFLALNVWLFEDTLGGANQVALILTSGVATIVALSIGVKWKTIEKQIMKTIDSSMPSLLILFLIGALAGTWMLSGVVPAMIYYGLDFLSPSYFLVASVIVTAIISISTGSSWSTIATIGVALLGIGKALGFSEDIVAGAIISGAYFGDKMSPLSDTTNLAPAMAGTDLFTHIKHMMYTTVPTVVITLIIFTVWGFAGDYSGSADTLSVQAAIKEQFYISPILFLVPAILIILIVKKMPAIPALMIGTLLGGLFALILQPSLLERMVDGDYNYGTVAYKSIMQAMFGASAVTTSNQTINELLGTSGMAGMLPTVWLILSAMVFGGVMEASGFLKAITDSIIQFAKSTTSLVASTVGVCIFFNVTAADQYLAIVVPGRMFAPIYKEKGLKPELLSRTLEDSGTVVSVLIPWNTCGAAQAGVLGVSTLAYLPYCFFNLLSPFMTILVTAIRAKKNRVEVEIVEGDKIEDIQPEEKV